MNFECGSNVVVGAERFCPAKIAGPAQPADAAPVASPIAFTLKPNEVALALFKGDVGLHIGFVFCPEQQATYKFVHLAFHHWVKIDSCPLDRCSIIGKLPFKLETLKYLRRALERIGTNLPMIPYGVRIAKKRGVFNTRGRYALPTDSADGLTCATFVSEVCRGVGRPILIEDDWEARPAEDAGWIDQICAMLSIPKFNASAEHIAKVRASFEGSGFRIRPEDVAAIIPQWRKDGAALSFQVVDGERKLVAQLAETCCTDAPAPADPPEAHALGLDEPDSAIELVDVMHEADPPQAANGKESGSIHAS
jgi:hypothetical protein